MSASLTLRLQEIDSYLQQQQLQTLFMESNEQLPVDLLNVQLPNFGTPLSLMFIPLEDMEQTYGLLQFYFALEDAEVNTGNQSELMQLLLLANTQIPIGGFGFQGEDQLYFRHVLMLDMEDNFSVGTVLEAINFVHFIISYHGQLLLDFCSGNKTSELVRQELTPG